MEGNSAHSQKKKKKGVERQKHSHEEGKFLGKISFNQKVGSKLGSLEKEGKVLQHIPKSQKKISISCFPPTEGLELEVWSKGKRWNRNEQGGLGDPGEKNEIKILKFGFNFSFIKIKRG